MKKLAELRAERGALIDKLSALTESDKFEAKEFDAIEQQVKELDGRIERLERAQQLQASLAERVPGAGGDASEGKVFAIPRSARLKNFKGEKAAERAFRFGHFMLAAVGQNAKSLQWCKDNGVVLTKAQSEGVNSAGGVFVPDEFSSAIIDLRDEYGMFRRLCTPFPMGRDTLNVPRRTGGLTAYAVGEATAITASTTAWDNVELIAKKWGVLTLLSSELDEDAVVNIGDILVGEIAYAFANAEDTAGFNGDGTSTYHGIKGFRKLFADGVGSLAGAVDGASGHDTFAEMDATDLTNVMGKLPQYVYMRGRPAWYCSQVAWAMVFQRLVAAAGGISKDDITGKVQFSYLGFPVEITPSMPTTTGDLSDVPMILFGDIAMAAAFGDRRGMTVARSTDYKFAEDQIAIKGTERFDINIHDIGDTSTPGPVVALMGE